MSRAQKSPEVHYTIIISSLAYKFTLPAAGVVHKASLSTDNKINIIIGVLTVVIGILSAIIAWATWRLSQAHCRRIHESPSKL